LLVELLAVFAAHGRPDSCFPELPSAGGGGGGGGIEQVLAGWL
jgi:hypothetical protein